MCADGCNSHMCNRNMNLIHREGAFVGVTEASIAF